MRWRLVTVILWLIGCGIYGHGYAAVWRSNLTLWAHVYQHHPNVQRARFNYAAALMGAGDVVQADAVIQTPVRD